MGVGAERIVFVGNVVPSSVRAEFFGCFALLALAAFSRCLCLASQLFFAVSECLLDRPANSILPSCCAQAGLGCPPA